MPDTTPVLRPGQATGAGFPGWLPVLLGFLTAVGPVSTDMYLPAFPAMESALGAPAGSAQITLATWFAGLAVGQMTQGTLSDRYGRRIPLLIGTVIFTVASAGCALAGDITSLSIWRAVAAFGGSASMVVPRAVVRDLADGHQAARLMSRLMLVMGAVPILAPTLGGVVLGVAGWRTIFWIATVYGALCIVLVATLLPDTLAPERRVRLRAVALLSRYLAVARDRSFLSHALMAGSTSFTMFAYLGGSPPVFIELYHLTPTQFGFVFMGTASAYIGASQLNTVLLGRFGHHGVVARGVGGGAARHGLAVRGGADRLGRAAGADRRRGAQLRRHGLHHAQRGGGRAVAALGAGGGGLGAAGHAAVPAGGGERHADRRADRRHGAPAGGDDAAGGGRAVPGGPVPASGLSVQQGRGFAP